MESRRFQLGLYCAFSVIDFAASVFLISHGYASEANPLINGFARQFVSFGVGLAVYKCLMLTVFFALIKVIYELNPPASSRLLIFANTVMAGLSCWHIACLHMAQVI